MLSTGQVLFTLAAIVIGLYWYLTTKYNYWRSRNVPHKKPLPVFGNFLDIVLTKESTGQYFSKMYNECNGPYFGFFTMDKPFLLLKDLDIIKRVIIKDFNSFSNRFFYNDEKIDSIIANVLFGIKNPQWRTLRKKLSPVFSTGKIKMMLPLMMKCGDNMLNYLGTKTETTLNTKELAAKFTTDVIASCAFGINANSFDEEDGAFRIAGRKIFKESFTRTVQPLAYVFGHKLVQLFKLKFIEVDAANFLKNVFDKTIKQREVTKNKRNDLIDLLIELKNEETKDDDFKFDGDRLVAQAIIFFAAGHETTSTTIAFSLYEMALNQNIQNRLREEIRQSIKKHGELTYEGVQSMKFLHAIISETLRKYPLAPFLQRQCEENYLLEETGLVIERGVVVLIPLYGLHWDPNYFPEPQKYDPDRFSDEKMPGINPFSYLPFGDGPRRCIGERFGLLNAKLGLIHIVKNFMVTPSPLTKSPLVFGRALLLQSVGGVPLTYKRIKD